MKNNRPSNTIINAFLLVVASLAIYLVGALIISGFQHTNKKIFKQLVVQVENQLNNISPSIYNGK
ncbi:MAG: hypothetical protein HC862_01765 [Scytonema sp. RU_4_4]|nr:hypothetical protein [Scytonema sp. RU_4_4]NJR74940.1 hypothetical protein [Scytonema sp. CRU_2_7]